MKKKCLVALFVTFCTNIIFAQETVAHEIKFKTNDGVEYSISSNNAKTSKTVEGLLGDVDTPGLLEIPLPLVSSEQWELIKPLFSDPQAVVNNAVQEAVFSKWLDDLYLQDQNECGKKLVNLVEPIEYLDVKVRSENENEIVDGADLLFERLKKIINESPDPVIELLKAGKYSIPPRFEHDLSQALLIAKGIIQEPFSIMNIFTNERDVGNIAWFPDGRLAVSHLFEVEILNRRGEVVKLIPCSNNQVPNIRISPQGRLFISDGGDEQEMELDLTIKTIPTERNTSGPSVIACSSDETVAIVRQSRVFIRKLGGEVYSIPTPIHKFVQRALWSENGELAVQFFGSIYLFNFHTYLRNPDHPQFIPIAHGQSLFMVWTPDGRLIIRVDGKLQIYDPQKKKTVDDILDQDLEYIISMAYSPAGTLAILHHKGLRIRRFDGLKPEQFDFEFPELRGISPFNSIAWSTRESLGILYDGNVGLMSPDRKLTWLNKKELGYQWDISLSHDGDRFAFLSRYLENEPRPYWRGGKNLSIYANDLEEYRNLRLDQALLIILLDRLKIPHLLTHQEYDTYMSLPDIIKKRYPLPKSIKRNRLPFNTPPDFLKISELNEAGKGRKADVPLWLDQDDRLKKDTSLRQHTPHLKEHLSRLDKSGHGFLQEAMSSYDTVNPFRQIKHPLKTYVDEAYLD